MVVIPGIEIPDAGMDLTFIHSEAGVKLEKLGITDQAALIQLISDFIDGIRLVHRNGNGFILPSESQNIRCADPEHPSQGHTDGKDNGCPNQGHQNIGNAKEALPFLPAGTAFPGRTVMGRHGLLLRLGTQKGLEFFVINFPVVVLRVRFRPVRLDVRLRFRQEIPGQILRLVIPINRLRIVFLRFVQLRVIQDA